MYIQKFKEMKQEHGNKMTALVVGGAGGLGRTYATGLSWKDIMSYVLIIFHIGSMENIKHLLYNSSFSYLYHDVTMPMFYDGILLILNLVYYFCSAHYQEDAVCTTKTAVIGTQNLLDLARTNKCPIL